MENFELEKLICKYAGMPVCTINGSGKVTAASSDIGEVFVYDKQEGADIFTIAGIKYSAILESADSGETLQLNRNDRIFRLVVRKLCDGETPDLAIYFKDITNYENLKAIYNNERACIGIIHVDNYDELQNVTPDADKLRLDTDIDKCIRQWGTKIDASITRYKPDMFFCVFEYKYYDFIKRDKFSVLDKIREIETEADFPVTLSVGIGIGGRNYPQNDTFAQEAVDLALGRGGDQAVIKRGQKLEYYGGVMKAVEKSNKGKSRIIYYGFKLLVEQASNVLIMGHRFPDMDAFGSALGIHRLAKDIKKDVYIVINEYNETLSEVFEQAKETETYEFITSEKALNLLDDESLVVLLDTHRAVLAECPGLVDMCERLVIIDHHRRSEDAIDNATLAYMEPYASSTSELVTEMLQYAGAKKTISKLEAEALLGGMTIDTNRFAVQTGVRTFEAASWLRRAGADTTEVKRFFRMDTETFKIRA
ncbi:MAG: DHH family phosphoesterase, partial [Clostridia bacterium]|nr:DHH family phosphoesterase [Clostridia bacterium]